MELFSAARCQLEAPKRVTCHMGPEDYPDVVTAG
jgi:hypothetical protein